MSVVLESVKNLYDYPDMVNILNEITPNALIDTFNGC